MTGYRAFSRRFVKSFPVISQGFEIETEMTIHALDKNLLLTSIPISYRDRPVGSFSKLSTVKDGIRVLLTIFNLFRVFFSCLGRSLFPCCAYAFFPGFLRVPANGSCRSPPDVHCLGDCLRCVTDALCVRPCFGRASSNGSQTVRTALKPS